MALLRAGGDIPWRRRPGHIPSVAVDTVAFVGLRRLSFGAVAPVDGYAANVLTWAFDAVVSLWVPVVRIEVYLAQPSPADVETQAHVAELAVIVVVATRAAGRRRGFTPTNELHDAESPSIGLALDVGPRRRSLAHDLARPCAVGTARVCTEFPQFFERASVGVRHDGGGFIRGHRDNCGGYP